jgi:diguanylate cyclase (GGDEF)-like protein
MLNIKKEDALLSDRPIEKFEGVPVAILYYKSGLFWYGSTTKAYNEELRSVGFKSLSEAECFFNSPGIVENFKHLVDTALLSDSVQIKEFVAKDAFCAIRVRCYYSEDDHDIVVCRAILKNISKLTTNYENANKEMALRNLLTFYDHVNLVDVNELFIKRIYTNKSEFFVETNGNSGEYLEKFAQKYIHPDEADEYISHNQPEYLKEQFDKTGKNFIVSYYQVRNIKDEYIWKAFVIVKLLGGKEGLYLSYMRDIDAITEHVLIRHDYVRLFNEMPLAYAVLQVDLDDSKEIADIKCIFMSSRAATFMGVDVDKVLGKSVYIDFDDEHLPIMQCLYEAAYDEKRSKGVYFSKKTNRWINIVVDKGAQKGRCALILEDVTKEKMTTDRLGLESRTDDLIISCTKLLHSGLPHEVAVDNLLKMVGESIEAGRIYIVEKLAENYYSETFEWCNEGVRPVKDRFKNMTGDDILNWEKEYPGAFNIVIDDVETIKEAHPRLYSILASTDTKSIIEMPILDDGQCIGYFGAINHARNKIIDAKLLLETISYFLASEFSRRRLIDELEKKSVYDELCGVKNRSAMEMAFKKLRKKEFTAGVMFADANGLKTVNDTQGHEAGDELLKRICVIMKKRFNRDFVYRAGGDEFVIVVPNMSKEDFESNCEQLKADFDEAEGVSVAVGWSWGANSADIDAIMKTADTIMYEDKALYYKHHNRRRSSD